MAIVGLESTLYSFTPFQSSIIPFKSSQIPLFKACYGTPKMQFH